MTVTAHRTGAALGNIEDLLVTEEGNVSGHTVLTRVGDPALRQAIEAFDRVTLDAASPHHTLSLSALDLLRARAAAAHADAEAVTQRLRHHERAALTDTTDTTERTGLADDTSAPGGPGGDPALRARLDAVTAWSRSTELARAVEAAEHATDAIAETVADAVSESTPDLLAEVTPPDGERAHELAANLRHSLVEGLVTGMSDAMTDAVGDTFAELTASVLSGSLRLRTTVRDGARWEVSLVLPGTWGATEADLDTARRELREQLTAAFGDLAASVPASTRERLVAIGAVSTGPASAPNDGSDDLGALAGRSEREAVETKSAAMLRAAAESGDVVGAVRAAAELLGLPLREVLRAAKVKPSSFYSWEQARNASKGGAGRPLRPRRGSIGLVWALVQAVEDLCEVVPVGLDRWLTMDEARLTALLAGEFDDLVEFAMRSTTFLDSASSAGASRGLSIDGRSSRPSGVYHDDGTALFNPGTRPGLPARKGTAPITPRRAVRQSPANSETGGSEEASDSGGPSGSGELR